MRAIMTLIISASALSACGTHQTASKTDANLAPQKTLFAVFGGNSSCKTDGNDVASPIGMALYAPFMKLATSMRATAGEEVEFYLSCFTKSNPTLHYITSDAAQDVKEGTIADLPALLADLSTEHNSDRMIIAGHSYGGWTAMEAALTLPETVSLAGLFTIDPISRVNCKITDPANCNEAPSDITEAERTIIKQRSGTWINYFETNTWYLHSGPISDATRNIQEPNDTHYTIPSDPQVWDVLSATANGV